MVYWLGIVWGWPQESYPCVRLANAVRGRWASPSGYCGRDIDLQSARLHLYTNYGGQGPATRCCAVRPCGTQT